jgi:hypothetical protein
MKQTKANLTLLSAICLLSASVMAGPPLNGIWTSTDIGGVINTGRYMEAYTAPNGAVAIGTTLHAQSWDGMNLGLEWSYSCGVIESEPVIISDFVNASGTGSRTYEKQFVGGTIWLSGSGPWGNGDPEYTGPILTYVEYETVQYVNWVRVHAVTNVTAIAQIEGYNESCLSFTVANGVEIGSTDFGDPVPGDYPTMLEAYTCNPISINGAWWNMMTLSLYIDSCTVSNEDRSWGAVKSLYR